MTERKDAKAFNLRSGKQIRYLIVAKSSVVDVGFAVTSALISGFVSIDNFNLIASNKAEVGSNALSALKTKIEAGTVTVEGYSAFEALKEL